MKAEAGRAARSMLEALWGQIGQSVVVSVIQANLTHLHACPGLSSIALFHIVRLHRLYTQTRNACSEPEGQLLSLPLHPCSGAGNCEP